VPDPDDPLRQEAATLWRVGGYGRERHAPSAKYWFENAVRDRVSVIFQYDVSGEIHYRDQRRQVHTLTPGHALLFMHGEDTAYGLPRGASEAFVTEFIGLTGAGLREHWALLRAGSSIMRIDPDGPVLPAMRRLMELSGARERVDAATMAAEVHAFVMLLHASQRRAQADAQSAVERALDELVRHPTAPWSLKQLADRHRVSREHLSRSFHARHGLAPAAWLAQQRLERALSLLRDTVLPVAEVARQAGYASTHTMARQVRAATGRSPRAVRAARTPARAR
jgi:AraC-like DNA-binding protein